MNTYYKIFLILFTFSFANLTSQTNIKDYEMQWEGKLNDKNAFNLFVAVDALNENEYLFSLYNKNFNFSKQVTSSSLNFIEFNIDDNISFSGILNKNKTEISGFISSGMYFYHTKLTKGKSGKYIGKWNIFLLEEFLSKSIFLSIENVSKNGFDAYPFFGDQRFAGTHAMNAQLNGNVVTFQDFRTGTHFRATLLKETIELEALVANTAFTKVTLQKTKSDWKFGDYKTNNPQIFKLNDGWKIKPLKKKALLEKMEAEIYNKKFINTHAVLIAKKGKLVYEKYFDGYTNKTIHDQRSASKSIASAITGIAIEEGLLKSDTDLLYNYLPKEYQNPKDILKSEIKIKDLLTMSSGLDAVDFGIKRRSKASEDAYQNSRNWLKTVLDASMINKPGAVANYGSANPYLLSVVLNKLTPIPLQLYMDQKLLNPLGISNYAIQKEMTGKPYFGGGMYLSPRQMLKFGQLYLCKGKLNGERIISKNWVKKSFTNYLNLENAKDKNGYGYLWWHKTYMVNGKEIKSIEARGNGGQYIFVIPELDVVSVITSGNFRNGKTQQPEIIFEKTYFTNIIKLT